jgi:hypothetical protein
MNTIKRQRTQVIVLSPSSMAMSPASSIWLAQGYSITRVGGLGRLHVLIALKRAKVFAPATRPRCADADAE